MQRWKLSRLWWKRGPAQEQEEKQGPSGAGNNTGGARSLKDSDGLSPSVIEVVSHFLHVMPDFSELVRICTNYWAGNLALRLQLCSGQVVLVPGMDAHEVRRTRCASFP